MPNWRNKVSIKKYLSDEVDDNAVLNLCNALIPQLERILKREQLKDGEERLGQYFIDELFSVIEEFIWIKESIEQNKNSYEFEYESWCEAFNNYLEQLYDMGDVVTTPGTFSDREKFLWVG